MPIRKKEMCYMNCFQAMQSAKISSYRVNTKEQNIKILVNTWSCRKPVLSEAHFRLFFFLIEEAKWAKLEVYYS
jgi:hypothetical protein